MWRTIVALLLVLPVGAYAIASLLGSGAAEPDRRDPIVIRDVDPDDRPTRTPTAPARTPRPTRTTPPTVVPPRPDDDDVDDDSNHDDEDEGEDDDGGDDDGDDD